MLNNKKRFLFAPVIAFCAKVFFIFAKKGKKKTNQNNFDKNIKWKEITLK